MKYLYNFMDTLNFKNWLAEDSVSVAGGTNTDPDVAAAAQSAKTAAMTALKMKKNPVKAAQQAVLKSNVPVKKLGAVMPKDQDDSDDSGSM